MQELLSEFVVHIVMIGVYLAATILGLSTAKKLYGGKFTSSLPYFIMAVFLFLSMAVLTQLDFIFPQLMGSDIFIQSIQVLQLLAGIFLLSALYNLYQSKFLSAGFIETK